MAQSCNWLKETATYTQWPQMPRAHGPFGKDKLTPAERRHLRGIPLFLNVQTAGAIRTAHALGGRALSYLSFRDTYVHTAGFENGTARVPWDPRVPQMLLLDREGRFCNTPMDGTWRMWRYQVCNNTRAYQDMALQMVRVQMERGADGIFIDNSGKRVPCYGHGVPVGYSKFYRQVCAAIVKWPRPGLLPGKTPEELYRMGERPVCRELEYIRALTRHVHMYPGQSHDYAYSRLLARIRRLVKSYGADKIVVTNGENDKTGESADGVMLESYIFSWTRAGAVKGGWRAIRDKYAGMTSRMRPGSCVLALSYLGHTAGSVAEDALFAVAAASLSGYLWSDYGTYRAPLGDALRRLNMGRRLAPPASSGPVDYCFFAKGLAVINDSNEPRSVSVRPPSAFKFPAVRSMLDGRVARINGGRLFLDIPPQSGRIFLGIGA